MNRTVFFVRHGETLYNKEKIFRGRADISLNENGRSQADFTARKIQDLSIEAIYTSPMKRALETASIINSRINVPLEVNESFQNIDIGEWTGEKLSRIEHEFPKMWELWKTRPESLVIPGGEMIDDVRERSYQGLLDLMNNPETPEKILVVSHRSVLKCLFAAILNMEKPYFWKTRFENCSLSRIDYSDSGGFSLIFMNNDLRSSASRKTNDD